MFTAGLGFSQYRESVRGKSVISLMKYGRSPADKRNGKEGIRNSFLKR
jgi:hypothetical protein